MGIKLTPSLKDLALERTQLQRCRWGFGLIWLGFAGQLAIMVLMVMSMDVESVADEVKPIPRMQLAGRMMGVLVPQFLALGVAAWIHSTAARTPRWRSASLALLATLGAEVVLVAIGLASMGEVLDPEVGQPILSRTAFGIIEILSVLELWYVAVIIGEFAAACRENILLTQSEYLGYGVLWTLGCAFCWVAWTLPLASPSDDDMTQFFFGLNGISQLVLLLWAFQPISRSIALASMMLAHLDEVEQRAKNAERDTSAENESTSET